LKLKEWKFSKYTTKKLMKAAEMTSSRDGKSSGYLWYFYRAKLIVQTEKPTARSENLTRSAKVPETDSYLLQITRNVIAEAGNKPSVKSLDRLILLDRELFNNFCKKTCYTVQSDAVQQSVWRINVPQLAFSFDFVMHGILALSALHLAYLYPQKDFYVSHAQMHHQISLHKGRKLLPHITQENCSGLYIFSALVALYTLASPRKPEDFLLVGETGIAPWLLMFRGSRSIVDSSEAALMSGPLGPMYQNGLRRVQLRESCTNKTSTGEEQLTVLRNLIAETILDPTTFGIYAHAIEELRKSFAAFNRYQYNHGTTDAFIWVDRVSGEYLLRLGNKTQESLCIFAFFCVLLHQMNSVWWGEGWSTHLMTQIDLLLNEEHRRWIWWPVKQVHGLPDQPAAAQAL
jgi:hypothetical protein